ncbi:helix-turn-helix domain-containing protein [Thermoactinomyces mirandus]|uniref:Helix-turn-helix domain-containing protein n=1 Tax=Thermoactinomyces mirandus TaxID=2756294 RepID=A0A7W1XUD4_9BACL|nr:helix-turn-helix domain-containing protein [Thermoactinomyces mirandus]MBA4603257.1 helix-turn-helix domain-containing protein [Thermoactinomyces mirandus]
MIKVLLADDENLEREAFKCILDELGGEVSLIGEATDGKMAIKLAEDLEPDVIFMDVNMPGVKGTDAAKLIRKNHLDQAIYLMYYYSDLDAEKISQYADGIISKPVRPDDVQSKIFAYKSRNEVKLFSRGGLLEQLLRQIHKENFRESKKRLNSLMDHLLEIDQELAKLNHTIEIIGGSMLKICEAKGIEKFIPETNWKDGLTIYNAKGRLESLLTSIFQAILSQGPVSTQSEIQTILNYIEMHYMDGVSLEEVADFVHLSPHYVSRLFKKEVQTTFINYVTDRRIEHAKEMLKNTSLPVVNIAMKLSFQEHTYFSKVFKKTVGLTPTEYRNQFKKDKHELMNRFSYKTSKYWYI